MTIEDTLKAQARSWGVHAEQVDYLWDRHKAWCDAEGCDYGGNAWRSLCREAAKEPYVPTVASEQRRKAEAAAEATRKREIALKAYEAAALTFPQYLEALRRRAAKGEPVTEAEQRILDRSDDIDGSASFVDVMKGIIAP